MKLSLALILLVMAPATQPASRPVTPRADERVVEDATLRFRFAVPKNWKPVPQQAAAAVYVFGLPAVGAGRRVAPSFIVTAREGTSLQEEVDGRRKAIRDRNAGVTFDEDAATTLAGHDGWTFAYSTTLKQTVTEQPGNRQRVEQVAVQVRDQIVVINGRAVEFVLTSDEKGLPIRRRQVERVISTLAVE